MADSLEDPLNEEYWNLTAEKIPRVLESSVQDYPAARVVAPLLEAAIKHYRDELPPFVMRRASQRSRSKGSVADKTVILAENNSDDPKLPLVRTLVYRTWNDTYGFWTLDLNGERLIVKALSGGSNGGAAYRPWLGCSKGFQSQPIAYSFLKRHAGGSVKNNQLSHDGSDESIHSPSQSTPVADGLSDGKPKLTRSAKFKAEIKIKDAAEKLLHPNIKPAYPDENTDDGRSLKVKLRYSKLEAPAIESPLYAFKHKLGQTRRKSTDSELWPRLNGKHADRKSLNSMDPSGAGSAKISASANRRREVFSIPEPTKVALGSKRKHDNFSATDIAAASKRRREALLHRLLPSSERMREAGLAPESTQAKETPQGIACSKSIYQDELAEEPAQVDASSEKLTQLATTGGLAKSNASLEMLTQLATAEEPNLLDHLAPQKVFKTYLLVTIPPNPDFKIAKLSSCGTFSAVSTAILKAFRMEDKIDQVDSFRFKFEWLPASANYRTVLIEPDQMPSSFDYVLNRIDNADLWVTGGECHLGVDILLKEKR